MNSPPDDRPPPQSAVQAASQVTSDVVGGLKASPLLLGIVVLNCIGIAGALWFLNLLAQNNSAHLKSLLEQSAAHFQAVMNLCIDERERERYRRDGQPQPQQFRLQSDDDAKHE